MTRFRRYNRLAQYIGGFTSASVVGVVDVSYNYTVGKAAWTVPDTIGSSTSSDEMSGSDGDSMADEGDALRGY